MNATIEPPAGDKAEDERLELKPFLLSAVLWLPLAFFLWFALRSVVVYPVIGLVGWVASVWLPDLVTSVGQDYHEMIYTVRTQLGNVAGLPGSTIDVDIQVNVLPYCYSIPVLVGLSIATPISWARTGVQLLIGLPILAVVQAFGVLGDVLKRIAFDLGPLVHSALIEAGYPAPAAEAARNAGEFGAAALVAHGVTPTLLATWYQFGYLILPPISAVVLWILFNRRFIEALRPLPRAA